MHKAAILLTSHNKPGYVVDAINSAIHQKTQYPYLLYISENSTDDGKTLTLVKDLAAKYPQIVRLTQEKVDYHIAQINRFYETAEAEYLFYMHDDCILYPTFIERMVGALEQGRDCVYCGYRFLRSVSESHRDGGQRVEEVYTSGLKFPVPYSPDPTQQRRFRGTTEFFALGIRKSALDNRVQKPYVPEFQPLGDIVKAIESSNIFEDKLEDHLGIAPVLGPDGLAEELMMHQVTGLGTW